MTLDDLRRAAELLPEGGALLVPRGALLAALGDSATALTNSGTTTENVAPEEWLTAEQVAERLRVTTRWCYDHASQLGGKRLSRRCVRFSSRSVARYMERRHA